MYTIIKFNLDWDIISSLGTNNIRNFIVFNLKESSTNRWFRTLRGSTRKAQCLNGFIIIQQSGCRTNNYFSLSCLRHYINSISCPNVDCNHTFIFSIKSNSSRLCIANSARNISICFKNSKSRSLVGSTISCVNSICKSCSSKSFLCHSFGSLFRKSAIISFDFCITRIHKVTFVICQLSLYHNLSSRVRKIHLRTFNCSNFTCQSIKNVAAFAFGNSNSVMHILTIILNHCVFRTRVINHLVVTSNKQLFSNRMMNIFSIFLFIIFSNYFYINTTNRREFKGTENQSALRSSYESLCRFREYHCRTMNISLFSIFIFQDCIFKSFKSNCISYIFMRIFNRNNFNSSRRNIERNFSTFNYNHLAYEVLFGLDSNFLASCINDCCCRHTFLCGVGIVYSSQQILVRTKSMSSNNSSHLTREKGERYGTCDVNLTSNFKIRTINCFCGFRMRIICSRVLQYYIPSFRSRNKQLFCSFKIISSFKLFGPRVEYNKRFLLRNCHSNRTSVSFNCTICFRL